MKASIVTTLAILVVVVIIGRRQVDELAQLRAIAKTDSEDQSVVASSRVTSQKQCHSVSINRRDYKEDRRNLCEQ